MAFKVIILAALIAVSSAGILPAPYHAPYAAPVYSAPIAKVAAPVYAKSVVAPEPYDPHPQYNFNYDIHDQHTGDVKSQQEVRDGDVVTGAYSFIESDGARRVVEYTSDPEHGFNAVVHREEGAAHPTGPAAAPAYAKVAAPVYAKVAAPVYAAPVAKVAAYPSYSSNGYYH
ncbi:larval cuticle protein A3A-like [Onthophagus taurus]|uniref:larval cuticle protein A3A-like n=1 Tax=Onthophagus taurus TaxID=166361 RepID=UPI0039BE91D9